MEGVNKLNGLELENLNYFSERVWPRYIDRFTIVWVCSRVCNFSCEYCIRPNIVYTPKSIDEIVTGLKKFAPIRLIITGGEPLLYPNMIELCKKISDFSIIEMQSNLTVNAREFLEGTSPKYIERIEASFHPQEREKLGEVTIKEFIDNVIFAKEKGFNINVRYVDYPRMKDRYINDCKLLNSYGIIPVRKRYMGDCDGVPYRGDGIHVKGKKCNAGYKFLEMWENFDFTICEADRTVVGNLFEEVNLLKEPIICNMDNCGCLGRELLIEPYEE